MKIVDLLGGKAEYYLNHTCKTIDKQLIHIPGPDMIDKVWMNSDRNIRTLESLQALYGHGRLANTGYVSILPVDQGIEHSAGASFAPNPLYFDPENIIKLAIEGGCNAVDTIIMIGICPCWIPISRIRCIHLIPYWRLISIKSAGKNGKIINYITYYFSTFIFHHIKC